jgi:hypothetical protein
MDWCVRVVFLWLLVNNLIYYLEIRRKTSFPGTVNMTLMKSWLTKINIIHQQSRRLYRNTMSCGINIGYRIGTIEWNIFRTIHRMLLKYMLKRSIDFREKDGIGRTTYDGCKLSSTPLFSVFHAAQSLVFCVAFCGKW